MQVIDIKGYIPVSTSDLLLFDTVNYRKPTFYSFWSNTSILHIYKTKILLSWQCMLCARQHSSTPFALAKSVPFLLHFAYFACYVALYYSIGFACAKPCSLMPNPYMYPIGLPSLYYILYCTAIGMLTMEAAA